ncbi:MAG: class 1 isoprenoid biosynthesis enzyme [Alkalibacterium sp.]|nr:class 1 isoprenoid biosynthesis enzyme [Alkalibacterium sp.]
MTKQKRSLTIPVDTLLSLSIDGFNETVTFPSDKLKSVSLWRKVLNERQLKKMINQLFEDLEPYLPELKAMADDLTDPSSPTLLEVKEIVLECMRTIDEQRLIFDQPFLSFFIDQGYMDVAEAFLLKAKKEDDQLTDPEIFQAMRNIWIMNSLQLYWGIPLTLTAPMYAYSMLYPYTDNLLDDPDIKSEIKADFNSRLSKSLTGETIDSLFPAETRVFELVEMILNEFPLSTHPGVTESIQLIHKAQIESMRQTDDTRLTEEELLKISLFKGGTSVLADAFLIKGHLNMEEMVFSFHYGAFLQLLDDLQDRESDKADHNQTLFSVKTSQETIDQAIRQLISYIFKVNAVQESDDQTKRRMKDIISGCTLLMIMESVGKNKELVTPSLYKELETYSKVRLTLFKKLETKVHQFWNQ